MKANYANALCHCNATPLNKSKMEQCLGGGLLSLSLSLSLLALVARLCVNFTRLFTHSIFKAKIQIFHSKFKSFHRFNSFYKFKTFYKLNSFHKIISKFKPYTRLFHTFTPNFRSVFTDKFNTKGEAMAFTNE